MKFSTISAQFGYEQRQTLHRGLKTKNTQNYLKLGFSDLTTSLKHVHNLYNKLQSLHTHTQIFIIYMYMDNHI